MVRWLLILLVAWGTACGGATAPDDEFADLDDLDRQRPCDPFMEDVAVEIEPEPAPVCGDGRATKQRVSCSRRCSVGCGTEGMCNAVECETVEERCDGDDIALHGDRPWQCSDNSYAGGTIGCRPDCELDWSGCSVCIEREGLRCASAPLEAGRGQPMLMDLGERVAVIVRHPGSGDLVGGFVDPDLGFRAWRRPRAESTKDAVLYDGKIAYVAEDGSLKLLDVVQRSTEAFADPPGDMPVEVLRLVRLLPETEGTGIAVAWDWFQHDLGFAAYERDGSPATFERPRHFSHESERLIIGALPDARNVNGIDVDAGALVAAAASSASAGVFSRSPAGAFRFHGRIEYVDLGNTSIRVQYRDYGAYDQIQIQGEDLAQQFRFRQPSLPQVEGLGSIASAGGRWIDAFGGVLIANVVHTPGTLGLYHVAE